MSPKMHHHVSQVVRVRMALHSRWIEKIAGGVSLLVHPVG